MNANASTLPALTEEQFNALSQPEQRVAIAKDVLAQLEAKRIVAAPMQWVSVRGRSGFVYNREALIDAAAPRCFVCGIGACFVSAVRLGNQYQKRAYVGGLGATEMERVLLRHFPRQQYAAIEFAFEGGTGSMEEDELIRFFDFEEIEALREYRYAFPEPAARLAAICENIIAYAGDFNPVAVLTANGGYLFPVVASPARESETT